MLKLTKKNLSYLAISLAALLLLSSFSPALRPSLTSALKFPLAVFSFFWNEAGALIFFHHNFSQNKRFERENGFLRNKLNEASEVYLENQRLKELLSFKQKTELKVIACRVIGRSADNWSSVIIVDKGRHSGIKRGMAVINYLGLAGRVIETSGSTSKIMLINDPNLSVSAIVQRSRQEGLVTGTLGNLMVMKYLPADADIEISDTVVASGLSSSYPKGILIGTVTSIATEFSGLSRYALIKPAVNLSNLEEVLVVIQ
ncbi:MAG: rod shape-determining protein MreC [Candidatus Omnitrophota bacterium]